MTAARTTDRMAAESHAEQRARLAMELTGTFTAELEVATGAVLASPTMFAAYGLELPPGGRTTMAAVGACCHPDDRDRVAAETARILTGIGPHVSVFRILRADDGTARWIERRSKAWTDAAGRVWVLAVGNDITERRVAELAMADTERRLRLAVEAADMHVIDSDEVRGVVTMAPGAFAVHGLTPPADLRTTRASLRALVHPDDVGLIVARTDRLLADGGTDVTVYRILRADTGAERWLERRRILVRTPDGAQRLVGLVRDITGQRHDEAARQASEMRLRLAIDSAGLFAIEIDRASGLVEMSANAFAAFGLAPTANGTVTLETLAARTHPDDREGLAADGARLLKDRGTGVAVFRIIRADTGETRWLERHGGVLVSSDGKIRILGLARDITRRRELELALAESEARLRLAISAAEMFTMEVDVSTGETVASELAFAAHGLPPPADGRTHIDSFRACIHPDDRAIAIVPISELLAAGGSMARVSRVVRADTGEVRWLERHVTVRNGPDGRMRRLAIFRDITAQRRDRIARADSEERLRLAVAAAAMFTIEIEYASGRVVAQDQAFIAHGLPVPADGQAHIDMFRACHHPDDSARAVADTNALALADGTRISLVRIVRADNGEIRWLERHATARVAADGRRWLISIFRDVTEQRRDRMALAESEARLRLAIAAADMFVGEFFAGDSHGVFSDTAFAIMGLQAPRDGRLALEALRARYHPDEQAAVRAKTQHLIEHGGTDIGVWRLVRASDGAIRWVERGATAIDDSDGRRRVVVVGRDITEQRLDQIARAESEARLRLALAAARLFTIEGLPGNTEAVLSDQAFALLGIAPTPDHRLPVAAIRQHYHPDERSHIEALADRLMRFGGTDISVMRVVRAGDGSTRWVERGATALADQTGMRRLLVAGRDITERRQIEEALRASERRLHLAMGIKGFATWDLDLERGTLVWSENMFILLGYQPAAAGMATPEMFWSRIHPDDCAAAVAARNDAVRGGGDFDTVVRARHPDGTEPWLEMHGQVFSEPAGGRRFIGIVRDVTDARAAEEANAETQERLRLALDATDEGMWDWRAGSDAVWYSDRWLSMRGLTRDGVGPRRQDWERNVHPDDRAAVRAALAAHLRGNTPTYVAEYRAWHNDGRWLWIFDRGKVVRRDAAGRAVRMVGTNQDTTERHAMADALIASEARLRALLAAVPESVMIVRPDGAIMEMNEAGGKLIQARAHVQPEQIIADDFVAPGDRQGWMLNHARVCAGRSVRWEYDIVGFLGRRLRVESQGVPLRMPDGTVAHLMVSRDVTVRRAAEGRLRMLQAEAMRASRVSAVGAMAAGFAHELNQPLSAASNYAAAANMLLGAATAATITPAILARARETIGMAMAQTVRGGEIVRRLRDFIGRVDSELGFVTPAALIAEACEAIGPDFDTRPDGRPRVHVRQTVAADVGAVFGDRVQLVQVLTNLIRNAIEATRTQDKAAIVVSAVRALRGEGVVFTVADNGPGVTAAAMKTLFEPFVSTKAGGMGIGLAICRTIVEAHGGGIWAEPRERRHGAGTPGAQMRFVIPNPEALGPVSG